MIELERHIEILLLSNDCVIVPELGGFMAHHVSARYDEDDQLFLPPLRTLGFNPQLKINDSLLAQSYVEAYDISYPEALQRIEDEVNELKMHLETEGSYELNDIGILSLNEEGNYQFTPCEAGILSPSLYGLGSFEMLPLQKVTVVKETAATSDTEEEEGSTARIFGLDLPEDVQEEDEEEDVVRIKFSWIRNTVAVAAILLAIFVLALPTGKTELMTRTISNINSNILFGMMSKDTNTSKIEIKKEDIVKAPIKVDTILKKDTVQVVQKADTDSIKKGYCIVLASYVSKQNAQMFIDMLKQKGIDSAEIYVHNDVRRVIYGNYQTPNDAYIALQSIHKHKELGEAWVYRFSKP
ncbi:MAG: SPOR domain-containing protein [Prevotella sp.]|nr:SPOR domain-containing protein [Prevotella sp.]